MNKAIKDFVDYIQERHEKDGNDENYPKDDYHNGFWDCRREIIRSDEFKALKALSEQKMVVTDDFLEALVNIGQAIESYADRKRMIAEKIRGNNKN